MTTSAMAMYNLSQFAGTWTAEHACSKVEVRNMLLLTFCAEIGELQW